MNDDEYARLDGKVASLTAALLARKGEAAPSLKRFLNARGGRPCRERATSPRLFDIVNEQGAPVSVLDAF